MSQRLQSEAQRLRAALLPLASYAKSARQRLDPTDSKAAGKFRFVGDVETALNAVADYYEAADRMLNPPTDPLVARIKAHLQQQHLQARAGYPQHIREVLASFTAHHLPRPEFPDAWPTR